MHVKKAKEMTAYWVATAKHDYDTMRGLFKIRRYSDCLFYGHIVLEKILKALVVRYTREAAPYTHDLVRLSEIAELNFPATTIRFLNRVNDFNIRARYPERKLKFYKTATRNYTQEQLDHIIAIYHDLCQRLK